MKLYIIFYLQIFYLITMQIKKGKTITNNGNDGEQVFELTRLGYTLNRYYLINGKDKPFKSEKSNQIQLVVYGFEHSGFICF